MKKQNTTIAYKIPMHTIIWSAFVVSIASYCLTVAMITFDVVERRSLTQESQKLASYVAEKESQIAGETKLLIAPESKRGHIAGYIDPRHHTVGFAR